jgi:protein phosphatase
MVPDPEQATRELIDLANRGGGPDNITCIVADVVEAGTDPLPDRPVVAGAANATGRADADGDAGGHPVSHARDTSTGMTPTIDEEESDEEDDFVDEQTWPRRRLRPWAFGVITLVSIAAGAGYAGHRYIRGSTTSGPRAPRW